MLKIAILTTDSREHFRDYANTEPYFGTAPQALLEGFSCCVDVEIHVISCLQRRTSSPEKIAGGIFYHGLHVPKWGWLRGGYIGCIQSVRRKLNEIRPDIVHGQGSERDCSISAVYSGFRNVVTIHGLMTEMASVFRARPFTYPWIAARLEKHTLRKTRGVICNSSFVESRVQKLTPKTWQVPNAVRMQFFTTPLPAPPRPACDLLNIGVISPNKRQVEILDVAERLHNKGLRFHLRFVGQATGNDPYTRTFLDRVKKAERLGYAKFEGLKIRIVDLIELMDQCSALVHFPLVETFGLVVAESMVRGLKVFASRAGGIVDVVDGSTSAEVFNLADLAGLEAALTQWISMPRALDFDTQSSLCKRFHPRAVAERHLEIYREILTMPR